MLVSSLDVGAVQRVVGQAGGEERIRGRENAKKRNVREEGEVQGVGEGKGDAIRGRVPRSQG